MLRLSGWLWRRAGQTLLVAFALLSAMLGWKMGGIAPQRAGESPGTRPEPPPRHSPRSQALATWTAIFASLAAVGALVFTAFSVRYQAEQTGLQAAASRTQADQQNKQQAELVNTWPASEFYPQDTVTVSNRSQEPVYQFPIYVAFATSRSGGYLAFSTWTSFPPCTQVTFDLRTIAESYPETARLMSPVHLSDFDYGMESQGCCWPGMASARIGNTSPYAMARISIGSGELQSFASSVFRSFTPLTVDQFTTPEAHNSSLPQDLKLLIAAVRAVKCANPTSSIDTAAQFIQLRAAESTRKRSSAGAQSGGSRASRPRSSATVREVSQATSIVRCGARDFASLIVCMPCMPLRPMASHKV